MRPPDMHTYRQLLAALNKRYNRPKALLARLYNPKTLKFDRATQTGTASVTGIAPSGLPRTFSYKKHIDGSVTIDTDKQYDVTATGPQWEPHWSRRIKQVRECKNLDALELLQKTETSKAVLEAIKSQIEDVQ